MDGEQEELKLIGFWGILKETYKIIYTWRKIFTKITLSFILSLTIILLAFPQVIEYISRKYERNGKYRNIPGLLTLADIVIIPIFFLLPTSAILYTIACIYTAKQFAFKTVLIAVPKMIWKRLLVTFGIQFLIMVVYNSVALAVCIPLFIIMLIMNLNIGYILIIILVLYLIGFVYINVIWSLANVVSVLEDFKGCSAMKRSKDLLKGNIFVASTLFLLIYLPLVAVQIAFDLILNLGRLGIASKVGCGALCLLFTLVLILLGLVIQTIFYFVCKSFHGETIDKSYLANHLEVYMPAYVAEKNVQVQLEQLNV